MRGVSGCGVSRDGCEHARRLVVNRTVEGMDRDERAERNSRVMRYKRSYSLCGVRAGVTWVVIECCKQLDKRTHS